MSRVPTEERQVPRARRPGLRSGEAGLVATRDEDVPLELVERLRSRLAVTLPEGSRLYVHAPPLGAPGEEPGDKTRLTDGEALLEVTGASAGVLAPLLEAAARETGLPLRLVRRDEPPAPESDFAVVRPSGR